MEEKIILKKKKKHYQFIQAKNIAWGRRKNIKRAGVILYFFDEDKTYFILGLDKNFREWTDFGGTVNPDETGIQSGFREFHEETLDLFKNTIADINYLKDKSYVVIEQEQAIIFTPIDMNMEKFIQTQVQYREKVKFLDEIVENIDIQVFSYAELELLIKDEPVKDFKMYRKVSSHLKPKMPDIKHWSIPKLYSPR